MQATLDQIKNLERLYAEGYEDSFLDRSLRKIIAHQLAQDQADHPPEIPTFPHHLHLGREDSVVAGEHFGVCQVLDVLKTLVVEGTSRSDL